MVVVVLVVVVVVVDVVVVDVVVVVVVGPAVVVVVVRQFVNCRSQSSVQFMAGRRHSQPGLQLSSRTSHSASTHSQIQPTPQAGVVVVVVVVDVVLP